MSHRNDARRGALLLLAAALFAMPAAALETDRQQPLEVSADNTDGSLGDGVTVLSGRVDIRQGTLHIQADEAQVDKSEGKVRTITLRGAPATLEQEIEEQGLVQAEANTITYQVGAGIVQLAGGADVNHPQYQISGELLTYDLDRQHFEGSGSDSTDEDGRIRIRLEPEVAKDLQARENESGSPQDVESTPPDDDSDGAPDGGDGSR